MKEIRGIRQCNVIFIMGDFNAHVWEQELNKKGESVIDIMPNNNIIMPNYIDT